jgi:uncharacterized protein YbjQ (UPF0145 family)
VHSSDHDYDTFNRRKKNHPVLWHMGANIFKDLFASIRDIVGGRSGSYEAELTKARQVAFSELQAEAISMGANAIVGIDLDYEVVGDKGSMLMVSISGTAVLVED